MLIIDVASVVGIVLIAMTVACTAIIFFTVINVFIMVMVVVMCDVAMVVASVIVTVTLVEGVTTVTAVVGRTVDVILDVRIVIASVIIISAISLSATVVFVSVVNRKKTFDGRRTIRPTASSRRTTSPINFSRGANFRLKPVTPAQKAGRNGGLVRILDERVAHRFCTMRSGCAKTRLPTVDAQVYEVIHIPESRREAN